MFLEELQKFSKKNWWVYLVLITVLLLVHFTGNGNILEIILIFVAHFIAIIFVMIAIGKYAENTNKIGAVYHFSSSTLFTLIGLYGAFFNGEYQYLLFQISFMIAASKAILLYAFGKDIKILNEVMMVLLNIVIMVSFIYLFSPNVSSIIQGIGFSLTTIGLVSSRDVFRYFMNLLGSFAVVVGSFIVVIDSFSSGSVDGIALGFLLLTLSSIVYFLQFLGSYIVKIKK